MSDTNQGQSKQTFLIILVLLLILVAGIQTLYMLGMKQQLDMIHSQQSSPALPEQNTAVIEKPINETDNAVAPAIAQQSSLQGKEVEALVQKLPQKPEASVRPGNAPPLASVDTINKPFDAQTRSRYDEIQRMQYEMDRRFNQRFDRYKKNPDFQYHFSQSLSTPKMNVRENEHQYTVRMDLPGADESDISVNLDRQRLTVKGKQDSKKQSRNATGNMVFSESRSGTFRRSITLNHPVIQNKMKSHLDNGVLVIIIPKVKYEQRR
jgi:HSP20 family protein